MIMKVLMKSFILFFSPCRTWMTFLFALLLFNFHTQFISYYMLMKCWIIYACCWLCFVFILPREDMKSAFSMDKILSIFSIIELFSWTWNRTKLTRKIFYIFQWKFSYCLNGDNCKSGPYIFYYLVIGKMLQ